METDFQKKIYSLYPTFSKAERIVADYFAENYQLVPRIPLKKLCAEIGVSEPTIFRFCNDMGFQGIKDLKLYIASNFSRESVPPPISTISDFSESIDDQEIRTYINHILLAEEKILATTVTHIDISLIRKAANMLISFPQIYLYGLGSSHLVCLDAERKLMRMQISSWVLTDEEDLKEYLKNRNPKNLLFCISHSGATQQIVNAMRLAKDHNVPTLLMTSYPQSVAGKYADLILQTYAVEEINTRVGMTSRVSQFAVLDTLMMMVARLTEKNLFVKMDSQSQYVLSGDQ